jgi:hypothetical protein
MILYLVSQLVLTTLFQLYALIKLSNLARLQLELDRDLHVHIRELRADITLLEAKQGVNKAAFGLINPLTDFKETENAVVRKTRTAEQREKAAQKRREWWAKKKEEQKAPPQLS